VNNVKVTDDEKYILENIDECTCLVFIYYKNTIESSDKVNQSPYDSNKETA